MAKFYLTTAIDYSNGEPHLGHALEKIGADCIARYHRLGGDDVHFLMGMDEHSQSVIQAAARAGVTPQAWVDRMAATFADYWRRLHCSQDDWIRTTEPRHARAVAALLQRIGSVTRRTCSKRSTRGCIAPAARSSRPARRSSTGTASSILPSS